MSREFAYIGTYTDGESKGIYRLSLDTKTGKMEDIKLVAELDHPPYITLSYNNKFLYSIAKEGDLGGVVAFSRSLTGDLELINISLTQGPPPSHININKAGTQLYSANYQAGTVSLYPIDDNGSLKTPSSIIPHEGFGPNKERQEAPHVHYVSLTPDEKYLCAIDLGIDQLMLYSIEEGNLIKKKEIEIKPGSGPRHMDFHPSGKYAYLLTELTSEVITLAYNNDTFEIIQTLSTLPDDFIENNLGSAIHISPDGQYLYTSNRGHNSIAIFKINSSTGLLTFIQHIPSGGEIPRDFNLNPTGEFMIVGHQKSNTLVSFKIDKSTGLLTQLDTSMEVPSPVCVKFLT